MKHAQIWLTFSLLLLLLSSWPIFLMGREYVTSHQIHARYTITHTDTSQGFATVLNAQSLYAEGVRIDVEEIPTGKTAPLTPHDITEKVEAGEIVKLQWHINGQSVSTADEIWLSNRDKGARYYSWADVLTIVDRQTKMTQLAIVQRLTVEEIVPTKHRWKIIWIGEDGATREEFITYDERSSNNLAVQLINQSGTSLIGMGYYSDLMHVYPSLFYPILYPAGTALLGLILLLVGTILHFRNRGQAITVTPYPPTGDR